MPVPFDGLEPAAGREHAAWVVGAMTGRRGVALIVPEGFEAYARTDADDVDTLVPLLAAATTTPDACHYGLWNGWGWTHGGSTVVFTPGQDSDGARQVQAAADLAMAPVHRFVDRCPVEPEWGGRDVLLFDGPITSVSTIGWQFPSETRIQRHSPQWWWPDDRAWFVGTAIDPAGTYAAGSRALIDSILASPLWSSVAMEPPERQ